MDKTLLKGLAVLEALATGDGPRGVTELAVELGMMKSNVHRVLATLEAAGYVKRHAGGTYAPSLKLWVLGSRVHARLNVNVEAQAFLARLAALSRETVHLSVLDGREVIYVAKIDSPEPVRAYTSLGGRAPAHCVATGKVLLAYEADAPLARTVNALPRFTPRTITDGAAFLAALAGIRAKGYGVNLGEWRESVRGVAAPIRNALAAVVAAVGVSGPSDRLTQRRIAELVPHVTATAAQISAALGHRPAGGRDRASTQVEFLEA